MTGYSTTPYSPSVRPSHYKNMTAKAKTRLRNLTNSSVDDVLIGRQKPTVQQIANATRAQVNALDLGVLEPTPANIAKLREIADYAWTAIPNTKANSGILPEIHLAKAKATLLDEKIIGRRDLATKTIQQAVELATPAQKKIVANMGKKLLNTVV